MNTLKNKPLELWREKPLMVIPKMSRKLEMTRKNFDEFKIQNPLLLTLPKFGNFLSK